MARQYTRDNRGRFASVGATARGGRLRTASGNKRATQTAKISGGKPAGAVAKPKGLKPSARLAATNASRKSGVGGASAQPRTQKERWAARSTMLSRAAANNEAKAKRMFDAANTAGNTAFNTQPGRLAGRARMNAQTQRSFELMQKAAEQRSRAANLERLATANKGDAAKGRASKADAVKASHKGLKKGDVIEGVLYGEREVVKVNAKSVTVKGGLKNFTIPWEFIKPKAS